MQFSEVKIVVARENIVTAMSGSQGNVKLFADVFMKKLHNPGSIDDPGTGKISKEISEFTFSPDSDTDPDGLMHLRLYIPEEVKNVRGIYCYIHGWQDSSIEMVEYEPLRKYVAGKKFALLTFNMKGMYTNQASGNRSWSGEAFLQGLKTLARISGHDEIKDAPLLFKGHSAGGQFAYHFTLEHPERVIAFAAVKGGYHSNAPAGKAAEVPALMIVGEKDRDYRISNLTEIFKTNRKERAPWSLAMEPGAKHEHVSNKFVHSFFDAVIPIRLPVKDKNQVQKLRTIKMSSAWLGSSENLKVSSYENFRGDRSKASWLPSKEFAKVWIRFIKK